MGEGEGGGRKACTCVGVGDGARGKTAAREHGCAKAGNGQVVNWSTRTSSYWSRQDSSCSTEAMAASSSPMRALTLEGWNGGHGARLVGRSFAASLPHKPSVMLLSIVRAHLGLRVENGMDVGRLQQVELLLQARGEKARVAAHPPVRREHRLDVSLFVCRQLPLLLGDAWRRRASKGEKQCVRCRRCGAGTRARWRGGADTARAHTHTPSSSKSPELEPWRLISAPKRHRN